MTRRIVITIAAALVLLGMLRGCAAKTTPAYDPGMGALLASFDSGDGEPQPYGLPPSFAPAELTDWLLDERAIQRYRNLHIPNTDLDERLREAVASGEPPEIVGGYQGFAFREEELVLASDGSDLLALLRPTDYWYYLLCLDGKPEFLLTLQLQPQNADAPWFTISVLSQRDRQTFSAVGGLAANRKARSPLLISSELEENAYQTGHDLFILRTDEGDLGYFDSINVPVYRAQEGRHLIGYRQRAILNQRKWIKYYGRNNNYFGPINWVGYELREPGGNPPDFGRIARMFWGYPIYLVLLFGGTFGVELLVARQGKLVRKSALSVTAEP